MPTDELKQALRSANVVNVEKDFVDALCKMFDAPRALVLRLMYVTQYAAAEYLTHETWMDATELPNDLRNAITAQVRRAWRRVKVRNAIEGSHQILAWVEAMVPENKPEMMCDGCSKSLECVAESLHQPKDCRVGEGAWAKSLGVLPIKINKNTVTVECKHPRGQFTLDVKDFDL